MKNFPGNEAPPQLQPSFVIKYNFHIIQLI